MWKQQRLEPIHHSKTQPFSSSLTNTLVISKLKSVDYFWTASPITGQKTRGPDLTRVSFRTALIQRCLTLDLKSEVTLTPHSYPVGPTGRVKGVGSADEQRVVALLQQDLDEIMALVLKRDEKWENHILSFTLVSYWLQTFLDIILWSWFQARCVQCFYCIQTETENDRYCWE